MHQRRYFGMTVVQVGILAGLAVLVGSVLCVGLVLILADRAASAAPREVVIASPALATPPPMPTSAPRPTLTPEPTATPGVTSTPVPGWKRFEGSGAELWLPENYKGGNPATGLETIVAEIRALGPDFDEIANEVEQNLSDSHVAIFAFDANVGDALTLTTVQVISESLDSDVEITMDAYLDAVIKNLPADYRVVERKIEILDRYQAGRLSVDYKITDQQVSVFRKRLIYAIRVDDAMWVVQYLTERDDFKDALPIFELSIQTFVVQPK